MFASTEAASYLRAVLADQPDLLDGAAGLAGELGRLPLALAQAAAFMHDRNLTCAAYRARWTDRRSRLASLLPEPEGLPDEHDATVATTWSLSVEQARDGLGMPASAEPDHLGAGRDATRGARARPGATRDPERPGRVTVASGGALGG